MNPGKNLVHEVRAGFVRKGTSLGAYCRENGIEGKTVHTILNGSWNGPKAKKIRAQLIEAANALDFQSS